MGIEVTNSDRRCTVKKRGCLIAIVVVVGLIGAASYGLMRLQRSVYMSFGRPCLFVSSGVTEGYQAHFVTEGFVDRGIDFYIVSDVESQEKLIFVANLVYPNQFLSAVWSRDGAVVACRADVFPNEAATELVQKKRNEDDVIEPMLGFTYYVVAYDFQERNSFVLESSYSHHPLADWAAHSKAIGELLESHGGLGKEMSECEIVEQSKKNGLDTVATL